MTAQTVRADDRAHVFHSWSAQGSINPLPVEKALGSYFWDYDLAGREAPERGTVTADEVREGLSILDGALSVADRFCRG